MQITDSLEKILVLGKFEGRRRSGQERMRWLDGITNSMDINLCKLQEFLACCSPWGCQYSNMTERLNWTEPAWDVVLACLDYYCCCLVAKTSWTLLWPPMDCILSDSSVHGISQSRTLEWAVALLLQSPIDWSAYKQHKFISSCCGGQKVEIGSPASSGSSKSLLQVYRLPTSPCILMWQTKRVSQLPGFFLEGH